MAITKMEALKKLVDVVTTIIREEGDQGVPAGILYMALSSIGCTKANFDTLMSTMVATRYVTKRGNVYFVAQKAN